MTDREQALLAEIIANPDDDSPRLIFADWIEEQGDGERADFIRLQIELATYGSYRCPKYHAGLPDMLWGYPVIVDGETDHECKWCRLKKRERALLLATKPGQWSKFPEALHLSGSGARDFGVWKFRRGFVETIRLTSEQWLNYANQLTRLAPIREVELTTNRSFGGRDQSILRVSGEHWPNIKFTLLSPLTKMTREQWDFFTSRLSGDSRDDHLDALAFALSALHRRDPRPLLEPPPLSCTAADSEPASPEQPSPVPDCIVIDPDADP